MYRLALLRNSFPSSFLLVSSDELHKMEGKHAELVQVTN